MQEMATGCVHVGRMLLVKKKKEGVNYGKRDGGKRRENGELRVTEWGLGEWRLGECKWGR